MQSTNNKHTMLHREPATRDPVSPDSRHTTRSQRPNSLHAPAMHGSGGLA